MTEEKIYGHDGIAVVSPDRKHVVWLTYQTEVPYTEAYYTLTADDVSFGSREFWDACLWSADSRFFAIAEVRFDGRYTIRNRLILLDFETRMECIVASTNQARVKPIQFKEKELVYEVSKDEAPVLKEVSLANVPPPGWYAFNES